MMLPGGTPATGQILSLECGKFWLARLQVVFGISASAGGTFGAGFTE
jgi:hypothetical protein